MARVLEMPFASPNAFVHESGDIHHSWRTLLLGQEHHRGILDAIKQKQATRAEFLLREHAYLSLHTLKRYVEQRSEFSRIPGGSLITPYRT